MSVALPPIFYLKQNNTSPYYTATLTDLSGNALNLTGATVQFHMTNYAAGNVVNQPATVLNPAAGQVQYQWGNTDTAIPGTYSTEWVVTFGSGAQQTYPLNGYGTVVVQTDISQGFPAVIQNQLFSTVRNGTTVPTTLTGYNGDFYVDTTTDFFYGPKTNGSWPAGFSLNAGVNANAPGYKLRALTDVEPSMQTQEYAAGPVSGASVTILSVAAGQAGVVEKIKIVSTGNLCLDGWLRISYDSGLTFPFVAEMGTLFGARPGAAVSGGPWDASCQHISTVSGTGNSGTFDFEGDMTYPIPFTNGVLIQLYNPTTTSYAATTVWSEAIYVLATASAVPAYQLNCTGSSMTSTTLITTSNNYTLNANNVLTGVGGFTLNSPDIAMNGQSTAGALLSLGTGQVGELANLIGPGWVVGLAYVGVGASNETFLERDLAWYVDGATPPVMSGGITTPTNGSPTGTGVGSPSMITSGTDNAFDSPLYALSSAYTSGSVTPASVPSSTSAATNSFGFAVDVYITTVAGTLSGISINGTSIGSHVSVAANATIGPYRVPPYGTITLTYSSTAPTWVWFSTGSPGGSAQTFSKTTSMITASGSSARNGYFNAFLDVLQSCGGYLFNSSLELWILSESRVTTSSNISWCLLYYTET